MPERAEPIASDWSARPLRRVGGGVWMSRDLRWRFARMEADGWWHVWFHEDDEGYGDKHATLRDAVASIESQGGQP